MQPKSVSECPPGTRLCAYWSQQYRCLYPGVAVPPGSPDVDNEGKYVDVEFDDGDNGRILLDHIRFLPADYAIFGKQKMKLSLSLENFTSSFPHFQNMTRILCSPSINENDH